jgi:hypothetical protein
MAKLSAATPRALPTGSEEDSKEVKKPNTKTPNRNSRNIFKN